MVLVVTVVVVTVVVVIVVVAVLRERRKKCEEERRAEKRGGEKGTGKERETGKGRTASVLVVVLWTDINQQGRGTFLCKIISNTYITLDALAAYF